MTSNDYDPLPNHSSFKLQSNLRSESLHANSEKQAVHVERAELLEVHSELFEHTPDTLNAESRTLIRGAYKTEDRLLLTLDIDQLVQIRA